MTMEYQMMPETLTLITTTFLAYIANDLTPFTYQSHTDHYSLIDVRIFL